MQQIDEIRPGVAVIIFDEQNRVLLQKRADVRLWGIPSGHVEPGETVEEAAIREVREETGLYIQITRLIGVYSDPESQVFHYPDGRAVHFITICFEGKIIGGAMSCSSPETMELRFFCKDNLPSNLLPMHPRWLEDALAKNEAAFIR
ncbi:NUDIX domain-containing protein [Bacillaceae bacterium]